MMITIDLRKYLRSRAKTWDRVHFCLPVRNSSSIQLTRIRHRQWWIILTHQIKALVVKIEVSAIIHGLVIRTWTISIWLLRPHSSCLPLVSKRNPKWLVVVQMSWLHRVDQERDNKATPVLKTSRLTESACLRLRFPCQETSSKARCNLLARKDQSHTSKFMMTRKLLLLVSQKFNQIPNKWEFHSSILEISGTVSKTSNKKWSREETITMMSDNRERTNNLIKVRNPLGLKSWNKGY